MSENTKNQNTKKFNFTKWGFILAIVGTVATVATVPEIRGLIRLQSEVGGVAQKQETGVVQKQEVELIIQTEQGEVLPGVKVRVSSKGAPEFKSTDNNGYAKVQIPSKGDVAVNLSKAGYPTQNFTINLENEQSTTRVINLSKSGDPEVKSPASAPPTSSSNPSGTSAASSIATNKTNNSYSFDDASKNLKTLIKTNKCSNCYLVGVDLENQNLEGADLAGANLRGARARCGVHLNGANLSGADLRGFSSNCVGFDLQGANLRGANLKGAKLSYANLRGADLTGVDLSDVNIEGADLAGAIVPNEAKSPK